jgi:hypothetical protein
MLRTGMYLSQRASEARFLFDFTMRRHLGNDNMPFKITKVNTNLADTSPNSIASLKKLSSAT